MVFNGVGERPQIWKPAGHSTWEDLEARKGW